MAKPNWGRGALTLGTLLQEMMMRRRAEEMRQKDIERALAESAADRQARMDYLTESSRLMGERDVAAYERENPEAVVGFDFKPPVLGPVARIGRRPVGYSLDAEQLGLKAARQNIATDRAREVDLLRGPRQTTEKLPEPVNLEKLLLEAGGGYNKPQNQQLTERGWERPQDIVDTPSEAIDALGYTNEAKRLMREVDRPGIDGYALANATLRTVLPDVSPERYDEILSTIGTPEGFYSVPPDTTRFLGIQLGVKQKPKISLEDWLREGDAVIQEIGKKSSKGMIKDSEIAQIGLKRQWTRPTLDAILAAKRRYDRTQAAQSPEKPPDEEPQTKISEIRQAFEASGRLWTKDQYDSVVQRYQGEIELDESAPSGR